MSPNKIALPVIRRLPRYQRYVAALQRDGVQTISSSELATLLGTTASQVRQDFNCFGGFGQQGVGYRVDSLLDELDGLLFSGPKLETILIGTGRLGRTISGFLAEEAPSFSLIGAFDNSEKEIGSRLEDLTVRDIATLEEFCSTQHPQIAVLCIPPKSTAALAVRLSELGFKGVWNFSHYDLSTASSGMIVENVHLGDSLASLGYRVRNTAE